MSQPHGRATISTGGAAKCVSVPPIDTLTNSRPSVAYFSRATGSQVVELPREQQRADRHRRRLGDERAEQRADRQDRHPPRRRRARRRGRRRRRSAASAKRDDRPRRGERHDHDHEQRLGVVDRVVEVVRRCPSPACTVSADEQHDRPQAEHHFDFAEEMQHLRRARSAPRGRPGAPLPARRARCWTRCASAGEPRRGERVQDREEEDAVATALNGSAAIRADRVSRSEAARRVAVQEPRKGGGSGGVEHRVVGHCLPEPGICWYGLTPLEAACLHARSPPAAAEGVAPMRRLTWMVCLGVVGACGASCRGPRSRTRTRPATIRPGRPADLQRRHAPRHRSTPSSSTIRAATSPT